MKARPDVALPTPTLPHWCPCRYHPHSLPSTCPNLHYLFLTVMDTLPRYRGPTVRDDVAGCPHPSTRGGARMGWLAKPVRVGWVDGDPGWRGDLALGDWWHGEFNGSSLTWLHGCGCHCHGGVLCRAAELEPRLVHSTWKQCGEWWWGERDKAVVEFPTTSSHKWLGLL